MSNMPVAVSTYYKVVGLITAHVILWGILLPYLISAANSSLVLLGVILALFSLPVTALFIYNNRAKNESPK